jgi:hypothetical protein
LAKLRHVFGAEPVFVSERNSQQGAFGEKLAQLPAERLGELEQTQSGGGAGPRYPMKQAVCRIAEQPDAP